MHCNNRAFTELGSQSNILFNSECILSIGAYRGLLIANEPTNEIAVLIRGGNNSYLTTGQKRFGCSIGIFYRDTAITRTMHCNNRAFTELGSQSDILFNNERVFCIGAYRSFRIANEPTNEIAVLIRDGNDSYLTAGQYNCWRIGYILERNTAVTGATEGEVWKFCKPCNQGCIFRCCEYKLLLCAHRCIWITHIPTDECTTFGRCSHYFNLITYKHIHGCSNVIGNGNCTLTVAISDYGNLADSWIRVILVLVTRNKERGDSHQKSQ